MPMQTGFKLQIVALKSLLCFIALCLLLFVIGGLTILLLVTPMWTKCKVNIQTKLTAVPPWRPSLASQENQ